MNKKDIQYHFQCELGKQLRIYANTKGKQIRTHQFEISNSGSFIYATYNFDNLSITANGLTKQEAIYRCIVKGAEYFFEDQELVEFLTYYTKENL